MWTWDWFQDWSNTFIWIILCFFCIAAVMILDGILEIFRSCPTGRCTLLSDDAKSDSPSTWKIVMPCCNAASTVNRRGLPTDMSDLATVWRWYERTDYFTFTSWRSRWTANATGYFRAMSELGWRNYGLILIMYYKWLFIWLFSPWLDDFHFFKLRQEHCHII